MLEKRATTARHRFWSAATHAFDASSPTPDAQADATGHTSAAIGSTTVVAGWPVHRSRQEQEAHSCLIKAHMVLAR